MYRIDKQKIQSPVWNIPSGGTSVSINGDKARQLLMAMRAGFTLKLRVCDYDGVPTNVTIDLNGPTKAMGEYNFSVPCAPF